MVREGQIFRLNRAGRHRSAVQLYRAHHQSHSPYGRRMDDQPWAADSMAALGWIGPAERALAEAQTFANNARLDPLPVVALQVGRLRVAARTAPQWPERAGRLAWKARSWLDEIDVPLDRGELDALFALVDGLLAETEGRFADAIGMLAPALEYRVRDPAVQGWIRAVIDRCLARLDPAAAARRRRAEIALAGDAATMPRWLAGLCARPAGPDAALDVLRAWPEDAATTTADGIVDTLTRLPEEAAHRAVWSFAVHRARGDFDAARAALTPLDAEAVASGWPLVAELCRADVAEGPDRALAARLVELSRDDDPAVVVVAAATAARQLVAAGDADGAVELARRALAHTRAAERSPLRWMLPPVWPCRALALEVWREALGAREGDARRSRRLLRRVDRALAAEKACAAQL